MNQPRTSRPSHPVDLPNSSAPVCSIVGVGSYVPNRIMTNADLEKLVETSDEWIMTRTGIRERRIAAPDEFTSDLAAKAAQRALQAAKVSPEQIDLIIVATITPDMPFPSTACLVQQKIGAYRASAFDLEAACSGYIYALQIGRLLIQSGAYQTVLVIGAEKLSSIVDWKDRNTCVLFGDGAGAAVLQNNPAGHAVLTACMGADGAKADLLSMPAGGSRIPASIESVTKRLHYLRMDGKEAFKNAVGAMVLAARDSLRQCQLEVKQLDCIIPHQANRRIIDAVAERLLATPEQVFVNLHKYGNTSAASVAIALDEAVATGRIHPGHRVLLVAFGAGLTWGAAVIQW